jgi:AcrR family transcriptional regulator
MSRSLSAVVPLQREAPRRHLSERQAHTVDKLTAAAVVEVRSSGYTGLTVRNVARRAGVAPATAYSFFTSKDHLVTEVFWRRLVARPDTKVDRRRTARHRLEATLADLALLVADEPELAAACTVAMLAIDPEVRVLRDRIGGEMRRRLEVAAGDGVDRTVIDALDLAVTGAMVRAGTGHLSYGELPDRLAQIAGMLLGDRR